MYRKAKNHEHIHIGDEHQHANLTGVFGLVGRRSLSHQARAFLDCAGQKSHETGWWLFEPKQDNKIPKNGPFGGPILDTMDDHVESWTVHSPVPMWITVNLGELNSRPSGRFIHVSPSGIDFVRICISGTSIEDLRLKCVEFTSAPVQKFMEFRSLVQLQNHFSARTGFTGTKMNTSAMVKLPWDIFHLWSMSHVMGISWESWKTFHKKKTVTDWWFPSPKIASSNTSFHHGTYALTMTCIAPPKKIEQ